MKIGIMQPYLFPYIGYFQLMNAVDEFIIYDNIQFSKEGWLNRNRILVGGKDSFITVPLKRDSDYLHIKERQLADNWPVERKKMLNRIVESYRKAPNFNSIFPLVEKVIKFESNNLFEFILNSLVLTKEYLEIKTSFIISSTIDINHELKSEEKVIEICKARKADEYINPIGGVELYSKDKFNNEGIELHFIKSSDIKYSQFNNEFVSSLSIIDVMMFNSKEQVKKILNFYNIQ